MGRNEDGSISKLSKRHGAVSFQDLITGGYLPEAILNYIAYLGWNPKKDLPEICSLSELCALFRIEDIHRSPAVFDYEKLSWFNGNYIRMLPLDAFRALATPRLGKGLSLEDSALDKLLLLIQPRLEYLAQIPAMTGFLFNLPTFELSLFANKKSKATSENARTVLSGVIPLLEQAQPWQGDALFNTLKEFGTTSGLPFGAVIWAVRIAISGQIATPGGATEILEILGREESLRRLRLSLERLSSEGTRFIPH
jgi:glutamyl-tRNA synthetase